MIISDTIGQFQAFTPKFVKKYANIGEQITNAVKAFMQDVEEGAFPAPENCYKMPAEEAERLAKMFKDNPG